MQTIRTATGYQLETIQVDSKPYSRLSPQQARTLAFVARGLPQKTIAESLGVKVHTVKKHCAEIGFKLNTHPMREAVHKALQQGLLRYTLVLVLCVFSTINENPGRTLRTNRNLKTMRTARVMRSRESKTDLSLV